MNTRSGSYRAPLSLTTWLHRKAFHEADMALEALYALCNSPQAMDASMWEATQRSMRQIRGHLLQQCALLTRWSSRGVTGSPARLTTPTVACV